MHAWCTCTVIIIFCVPRGWQFGRVAGVGAPIPLSPAAAATVAYWPDHWADGIKKKKNTPWKPEMRDDAKKQHAAFRGWRGLGVGGEGLRYANGPFEIRLIAAFSASRASPRPRLVPYRSGPGRFDTPPRSHAAEGQRVPLARIKFKTIQWHYIILLYTYISYHDRDFMMSRVLYNIILYYMDMRLCPTSLHKTRAVQISTIYEYKAENVYYYYLLLYGYNMHRVIEKCTENVRFPIII